MLTRRDTGIQTRYAILAFIMGGAFCAPVPAQIISGSNITFVGPFSDGRYSSGVYQNLHLDGTEAIFIYTPTSLGVFTISADEGSDWYLVDAGDVFSAETIAANGFPILVKLPMFPPPPPKPIPLGNFYLGMTTGVGFTNGQPNRDVFGWLELNNTGTQLLPLANAIAYNEPGIIIGTTTPAPEPATLAILAPLTLLLASRCTTKPRHRHESS